MDVGSDCKIERLFCCVAKVNCFRIDDKIVFCGVIVISASYPPQRVANAVKIKSKRFMI